VSGPRSAAHAFAASRVVIYLIVAAALIDLLIP
jgi:hypothetical protein